MVANLTYQHAFAEAIQGARITSNTIQEGAFVDYQFDGLRIVYPSGSHSRFRSTPADEAALWSIVDVSPTRCINHPNRPVRENLDGDDLCQECCEQWARAEQPDHAPNVSKWGNVPNFKAGFAPGRGLNPDERTWDDVNADLRKVEGGWAVPLKRDSWGRPL